MGLIILIKGFKLLGVEGGQKKLVVVVGFDELLSFDLQVVDLVQEPVVYLVVEFAALEEDFADDVVDLGEHADALEEDVLVEEGDDGFAGRDGEAAAFVLVYWCTFRLGSRTSSSPK